MIKGVVVETIETDVETLVSTIDLAGWLGEPITDLQEQDRAKAALSYAFTLVEMETSRDLDYWDEEGLPRQVRDVVLAVAAYGFTNPDSFGNERVDDWGGGARPVEELGMYLTATQKQILRRYSKQPMTGIAVLDTYRETTVTPVQPWADPLTGGIYDW